MIFFVFFGGWSPGSGLIHSSVQKSSKPFLFLDCSKLQLLRQIFCRLAYPLSHLKLHLVLYPWCHSYRNYIHPWATSDVLSEGRRFSSKILLYVALVNSPSMQSNQVGYRTDNADSINYCRQNIKSSKFLNATVCVFRLSVNTP